MEIKELHQDHLKDLRKSGLVDEVIQAAEVYSICGKDVAEILGKNTKGVESLLAFPYPGINFTRYKLFPPIQNKDGHPQKYFQPKGTGSNLYIPEMLEFATPLFKNDPSQPIAIAEGEKKALALVQNGVTTIGVAGVWNWMDSDTHDSISEFDEIEWTGRECRFYFDSDIWLSDKIQILKGVYALGQDLKQRGALVKVVVLKDNGNEKYGIDDYICKRGIHAAKKLKARSLDDPEFEMAAKWWSKWQKKNQQKRMNDITGLKAVITEIRKTSSEELKSFEKKRLISQASTGALNKIGTLFLSPEKDIFFFNKEEGLLLPLNDDAFNRFLADITGLNLTENEFNFLHEHLITEGQRRGIKTQIHCLSHYDRNSNRLYVNNFGGRMFALDGRSVELVNNGEDGILFVATNFTSPFQYLSQSDRKPEATLNNFLAPIPFDPSGVVSSDEARELLFIWFISMFFPELHPTKLIPTFIGPQGSTKTTTARRLGMQILGEKFNVGHLESSERGEQGFIATVCGKPFAAFDNADAPVKWLPDRLATLATGLNFELRTLYTTNELSIHRPMANIVLTSRDPYFRRPDVAERLLIMRLCRPEKFISEASVWQKTIEQRNSVWSDTLDILNRVVIALKQVTSAPKLDFRIADFAEFGWRICAAQGGTAAGERFAQSLRKLEQEQSSYATEEDPVSTCLGLWLENCANVGRRIDTANLFHELGEIARKQGLLLPKTSATLGKRLHLARRALETNLDIKITAFTNSHTTQWCFTPRVASREDFYESAHPAQPEEESATV